MAEYFGARLNRSIKQKVGLHKPVFKSMPIDNYESQISNLIDLLKISQSLPIKEFLKIKTVKQHLILCE